jgi:hypothetical protein
LFFGIVGFYGVTFFYGAGFGAFGGGFGFYFFTTFF